MDIEKINDMASIVATLTNQDIKDYIIKYRDNLYIYQYYYLLSCLNEDKLQKDFLDSFNQKKVFDDLMLWKYGNIDSSMENIVCNFIYYLFKIVSKIRDKEEKIRYLEKVVADIIPNINKFMKTTVIDDDIRILYEQMISDIICDFDDSLIDKILFDIGDKLLVEDKVFLYTKFHDDKRRLEALNNHIFPTYYNSVLRCSMTDGKRCRNYLESQLLYLDENEDIDEASMYVIFSNILKLVWKIEDDELKKEIVDKYYFMGGEFVSVIIASMQNDKIRLETLNNMLCLVHFDSVDYAMILEKIDEDELFRTTYLKYQDKIDYLDSVDIISFHEDKELALSLFNKYARLLGNEYFDEETRNVIIEGMCQLISLFDKEKQFNLLNSVRIVLYDYEEQAIIININDLDYKRRYVSDVLSIDKKLALVMKNDELLN